MTIRRSRFLLLGTSLAASAAVLMSGAIASAAPAPSTTGGGWSFQVSSGPAGVQSGGELAIDANRRELFVADNDFILTTKGKDIGIAPRSISPKVSVFGLDSRRPVRAIDFYGQPWGVMLFGPVPALPTPQVPDGLGIDSVHGKVIATNSHANGITVVSMNARTTSAANLISVPGEHPMGVGVDSPAGHAFVALNSKNAVSVIDTRTGREITEIGGIYKPAFLDVDAARHRLYVGNADYEARKTNYVAVVDTRTFQVIKQIPTPSNSRPKVDPATGRVYVASYDTGKISVIDPASLSVVNTIATGTTPNKIAIDGKRGLIYTANLQKRTVTVIDAGTQKIIATIPTGVAVNTIAVDPRTGLLYGSQHQAGNLTIIAATRR